MFLMNVLFLLSLVELHISYNRLLSFFVFSCSRHRKKKKEKKMLSSPCALFVLCIIIYHNLEEINPTMLLVYSQLRSFMNEEVSKKQLETIL